jgi:hypothetical protein
MCTGQDRLQTFEMPDLSSCHSPTPMVDSHRNRSNCADKRHSQNIYTGTHCRSAPSFTPLTHPSNDKNLGTVPFPQVLFLSI